MGFSGHYSTLTHSQMRPIAITVPFDWLRCHRGILPGWKSVNTHFPQLHEDEALLCAIRIDQYQPSFSSWAKRPRDDIKMVSPWLSHHIRWRSCFRFKKRNNWDNLPRFSSANRIPFLMDGHKGSVSFVLSLSSRTRTINIIIIIICFIIIIIICRIIQHGNPDEAPTWMAWPSMNWIYFVTRQCLRLSVGLSPPWASMNNEYIISTIIPA